MSPRVRNCPISGELKEIHGTLPDDDADDTNSADSYNVWLL